MVEAHLDFETRSALDLNKVGLMPYAQHDSTGVWGFKYRIGDGPMMQWRPGYDDPQPILDHIAFGGTFIAHNASFERVMWNELLRKRRGYSHWPELHAWQQTCTMARSLAMNLPGKLEDLGPALGLNQHKDLEGKKLMLKMCRPRGVDLEGNYVWWDEPDKVERLIAYCEQDVETETAVDHKVPNLTQSEQSLWVFDQIINERGVRVDLKVAERAAKLVEYAKKQADARMRKITKGAVRKVTEVGKLAEWVNAQGVTCEAVNKGTIKELQVASSLMGYPDVAEALTLRSHASKTSTSKYKKMMQCAADGDVLYFMLAFHAASTGRWGGRGVQPQNLPRFDEENITEAMAVGFLVELLNDDTVDIPDVYELVDAIYGSVLLWCSKALRSMFVAREGHEFCGGDFSNIEGRVNAWLAGEQWKLNAFEAYDAGEGPDLYKVSYSASFGCLVDAVTKSMRQIGKVQELASGYQGSIGAYLSMADNYGIDIHELAAAVHENADKEEFAAILETYPKAKDKKGLTPFVWAALKLLVTRWRAAHPAIVQSWWNYQDAAIEAVMNPGTVVDVADMSDHGYMKQGMVRYLCDGNYLFCCLPNNRVLAYAQPTVHQTKVTRTRKDGTEYETTKRTVRYWGRDSDRGGKWSELSLYGGLQCENVVQAVARDLLAEAMFRVEDAGYKVILTVHDEILSEVPTGFGSVEEFVRFMEIKSQWADGLPVKVAAWKDTRYVK